MGKSKQSKSREQEKAAKRRERRIERRPFSTGEKPNYGVVLAGTGPGRDALVHPSMETSKLVGAFLTPVATSLEMVTLGGPRAVLPRVQEALAAPVLFVLGAHKDRPGEWQLLVGGGEGGPLKPAREGFCVPQGGYGPAEDYEYLVEILTGVAKSYERSPETVARDLADSVIGQAVRKWSNWQEWAEESRPDLIGFATSVDA